MIELLHNDTPVTTELLTKLGVRCSCHLLPVAQQHPSVGASACSWQLDISRYGLCNALINDCS